MKKSLFSLILALIASVGMPSLAMAHTASASATCTTTTVNFVSFASSGSGNGGTNLVHYTVIVNGSNIADNATTSFTGSSKSVTLANRVYNGDVVKVTTWWLANETRDGHSQTAKVALTWTAKDCGTKPPPPPPVVTPPPNEPPPSTPPPVETTTPPPAATPPPAVIVPMAPPVEPHPLVKAPHVPQTSGSISGPDRCVSKKFRVSVKGAGIAYVTFGQGNDRLTVTSRDKSGAYRATVLLKGLKRNTTHRVTARIVFLTATGAKPLTKRLTFRRCGQASTTPAFTG